MALTETQRRTLFRLTEIWRDQSFVLVGACAVKVWRPDYVRATNDLDVSVAVNLEAHPAGLERASGWRSDARLPHRWYSPDNVAVDVLPAGPAILTAGRLDWPDGSSMNMTGFGRALSCSSPRDLGGGLIVPVAPLDLLALLKIIAYLDRPVERERDLEDLAYLLGSYVDDDDERLWTETPSSLDFDDGPSWLLGVDLGRRIEGRELERIEAFLGMARSKGGAHATAARMARHLPLKLRMGQDSEPEDILRGLLKSFEDGLSSTRSE